MKNMFFVYTGKSTVETEVVRELRPPRLLLSYHYFRTKQLAKVIEDIGYRPEIILDSGAYSAFTKGKNIALVDYMNYIKENEEFIDHYIALDVIGDSKMTLFYYEIMVSYGFKPIPVYHYGEDIENLHFLIMEGEKYIALGGTVPITDKNVVADWADKLCRDYPEVKFHLLGSSSKKLLDTDVHSLDSSTWVLMAINGYPKHIPGRDREAKRLRAIANMRSLMEVTNEDRTYQLHEA